MIVAHAIEDLSTTTIFMMIFGLARFGGVFFFLLSSTSRPRRFRGIRRRTPSARTPASEMSCPRSDRPTAATRGPRAQVLLSFGGGALAAYIYDEDRKKKN